MSGHSHEKVFRAAQALTCMPGDLASSVAGNRFLKGQCFLAKKEESKFLME
jgi:hypothetical protein